MMRSLATAVLLLLGLVGGGGARDGPLWSACQGAVCDRLVKEADGLARVKLLRGYVTETVKLLDSLMISLDHELVDIAEGMKEFVGPRCAEAHAALRQVAEPMENTNFDLSAGIMEETTAQKLERDNLSVEDLTSGIETSGNNEWSTSDSREQYSTSSSNRHSQTVGTGRDFSNSARDQSKYPGHSTYSNRRGATAINSWRTGDNSNYDNDDDDNNSYEDNIRPGYNGGGPWNSDQDSTSSYSSTSAQRSHGKGRSTSSYNARTQHYGGVSSTSTRPGSTLGATSWSPVPTGPTCKGLPGSPYAVPGIDNWCVENCHRGYCPASHCVCD